MKTNRLFIMALAAIAAVSCAQEKDEPVQTSPLMSFVAEKEVFDITSKAALVNGTKTEWAKGDEIAVYDGDAAHKFTADAAGARVGFSTESTTVNSSASSYLMVYPYSSALSADIAAGKVDFTVPFEQTAVAGSFDPAAAVSVASAVPADMLPGNSVKAKNALALLKINVPSDLDRKAIKITVEAKNGEALAGDVTFDAASKTNVLKANGKTSVSLLAAPPMESGDYYLAVRPCTVASGIKVTVLLGDKTYYTRESAGEFEFAVNTIYDLGVVGSTGWDKTYRKYVVSTVSGFGNRGDSASAGRPEQVGNPSETTWNQIGGIAYNPQGSLTVLDRGGNAVRQLDLQTYVATQLYKGSPLNAPWLAGFDATGTYYIANKGAGNILKANADYSDFEVVDSGFSSPMDVAFDASDNLHIVVRDNNATTGKKQGVYAYQGKDASTAELIAAIEGGLALDIDSEGNIFVTSNKRKLWMITPDGTLKQIAGNGTNGYNNGTPGQPLTANLGDFMDMDVASDGTIYLADDPYSRICALYPDVNGSYEHAYLADVVGIPNSAGYVDGDKSVAKFNSIYTLCLSPDETTILVGDRNNCRLRKVDVTTVTEQCGLSGDHQDYAGTDGMTTIF